MADRGRRVRDLVNKLNGNANYRIVRVVENESNENFESTIIKEDDENEPDGRPLAGIESLHSKYEIPTSKLPKSARYQVVDECIEDERKGNVIHGDNELRNLEDDRNSTTTSVNEVQNRLLAEIHELREQNELLEFRLLELEYCNKTERVATSEEVAPPERDENSDSGVMSLSPCEDFYPESDVLDAKVMDDEESYVMSCEVQQKLSRLFQYVDNTWDRIALQRAIDLIKHYEMRIIGMETTLTSMCQERIQRYSEEFLTGLKNAEEYSKSKTHRVIATVSPFTNSTPVEPRINESFGEKLPLDVDRLQESGIFDEFTEYEQIERKLTGTRTDSSNVILTRPSSIDRASGSRSSSASRSRSSSSSSTSSNSSSSSSSSSSSNSSGCSSVANYGLADELNKLEKIKQRIEERGPLFGSGTDKYSKDCIRKVPIVVLSKELAYFKEQYNALKNRLAAYESSSDANTKQLADKLQKENELQRRVECLTEKITEMEKEMRRLEEEKCEYEEAENDTRLRSQKLEVKLHALAEKKNDLQFQLQHHIRTVSTLRNTISELEKERDDALEKTYEMEMTISEYEERNFELEERAMDVRYRLQILESAVPVLLFWNFYVAFKRQQEAVPMADASNAVALLVTSRTSVPISAGRIACSGCKELRTRSIQLENHIRRLEKDLLDRDDVIACELRSYLQDYVSIEEDDDDDDDDDLVLKSSTTEVNRDRRSTPQEEVYVQTLQQADEIIVAIENDFKQKLTEMQRSLTDKHWRLEECERKLSTVASSRAMENHLLEKTQNLEADICAMKQRLRLRDEEKQILQQKEKRLTEELNQLNVFLIECQRNEQEMRQRLERERAVSREQRTELELKEREMADFERRTDDRINQLEKTVSSLTKEIDHQEVTNGELKEEVETLENTVCNLNLRLSHEMNEKEKMLVKFRHELALRQQDIDSLKRLFQDITAVSAAQEINLLQKDDGGMKAVLPLSAKYSSTLSRIVSTCREYELRDDATRINSRAAEKTDEVNSTNESSAHIIRHKHRYTIFLRPSPDENFSHFEVMVNNHRLPAVYEYSQTMTENSGQMDTISLTIKPKGL